MEKFELLLLKAVVLLFAILFESTEFPLIFAFKELFTMFNIDYLIAISMPIKTLQVDCFIFIILNMPLIKKWFLTLYQKPF